MCSSFIHTYWTIYASRAVWLEEYIATCNYTCNCYTDHSKPCPYNGDFRCNASSCIRSTSVCNRYNNCRDGSDEINCSK